MPVIIATVNIKLVAYFLVVRDFSKQIIIIRNHFMCVGLKQKKKKTRLPKLKYYNVTMK